MYLQPPRVHRTRTSTPYKFETPIDPSTMTSTRAKTKTIVRVLLLLQLGSLLTSSFGSASAAGKSHDHESVSASSARRVETLDYWDVDTLAYALGLEEKGGEEEKKYEIETNGKGSGCTFVAKSEDSYLGYDAVVLFYAPWCQNCHAMAPMYQRVSEVMEAGTKSANFVMALFDCEKSAESMALCSAAGVTHYPTIMYIGSGPYHDTDFVSRLVLGKDRAAGPAGHAPIERTVKFQGDWRYGEEIRDWIYAMKGLSTWHKVTNHGFLKWIRRGISGKNVDVSDSSLPVGIVSNAKSGGSTVDPATKRALKNLKHEVETYKKENDLLAKSALHADVIVDAILFHSETDDSYASLYTSNGWDKGKKEPLSDDGILRSCTMDLSVDYCSRVARNIPPEMLDGVNMWEIDTVIYDLLGEVDSFCSKIDMCTRDDFTKNECRPNSCPFTNKEACAYVATCLNSDVQNAYREVLVEQEKDTEAAHGKGWGVA